MLVALALHGCGLVKIAYNQGPDALYWWLDGYFDLQEVQTLRLRPDLDALQAWHRRNELPAYADLLQKARTLAPGEVTHDQMCEFFTTARSRALAVVDRAEPTVVALAPTLSLEQIKHFEVQLDKRNKKWRSEWMEGSQQKRMAHRVKEAVNRAEHFYGNLHEAQLASIRRSMASSTYDPEVSYREAVRRQQDALATLRMLKASQAPEAKVKADMRALFERSLNSPNPAYRTYQAAITREGCAAVAELHNSTTPAQRTKAAQVLKGYEDAFRELSASR